MNTALSSTVLAGNLVRVAATFRNDARELEDPTTVTIRVGLEGTEGDELDVIHDSTGTYHADWDTTDVEAGTYWIEAKGTGAVIAAREIRLKVRKGHLT